MNIPTNDLLIEIGSEELPALLIKRLSDDISNNLSNLLQENNLPFSEVNIFYTPRRVTFIVKDLAEKQNDSVVKRKGPLCKAAFDADGKPTQVALGFAKSCGVDISEIARVESDKGERLHYVENKTGQAAITLLPKIVEQAITNLRQYTFMRWQNYDYKYLRPVHWFVLLYGDKVVPAELFGIKSNNLTYGHRFLADKAIALTNTKHYASALENQGKVLVDVNTRLHSIKQKLNDLAKSKNAKVVMPESLLNENANLTEWPVAVLCEFDKNFLQVPDEVLISAMQSHQKSFALKDSQGNLLPYFIFISNTPAADMSLIIKGNEKVMHARLSDAAFLYKEDLQTTFAHYEEALGNTLLHKQLGSLQLKVMRMQKIAGHLAAVLACDVAETKRAALWSKLDLNSQTVFEFPELQGIIGGYYAASKKHPEAIYTAIKQHYLPNSRDAVLPNTKLGQVLSITDKIDNIVSIFAIGKAPTSKKDPFAIRRAALGVIRLALEKSHNFDLADLIDVAQTSHTDTTKFVSKDIKTDILNFFKERLKAYCITQGIDNKVLEAVLQVSDISNLCDVSARVEALQQFSKLPQAQSLISLHKRVHNILRKNFNENHQDLSAQDKLTTDSEVILITAVNKVEATLQEMLKQQDYPKLLSELLTLEAPIASFFEKVMVMADDPTERQQRLCLLFRIRQLFKGIADFSLLQVG
ncbi:MAG: glycine--tRNA ligase subunit beta [Thiotrichales bacterium]|nr:MAG: glycine--tRNA ligase subunit beta [Thiotrichales bacterium]